MPRTNTTNQASFTRPGAVTYDLPKPPYSSSTVTITLPPGSNWTSGLHWHETHTEYLQILTGSALVTLNDKTDIYSPASGIIMIPRYARHEWRRASSSGAELVVNEWTDPADGQKEVFFRNLSSVIQDWVQTGGVKREWWLSWQLYVVFWGLDNWPVLVDCGRVPWIGGLLEWFVTHAIFWVAVVLGRVLGLRGEYVEYTPGRSNLRRNDGRGGEKGKEL